MKCLGSSCGVTAKPWTSMDGGGGRCCRWNISRGRYLSGAVVGEEAGGSVQGPRSGFCSWVRVLLGDTGWV